MSSPLEGVRVIEVSQGIGGPYAAMLLSEMGAEVVKVEPPEGDSYRAELGFSVVNRSKQGVTLDFRGNDADRARLRTLILGADVLLHDFIPQDAEALGLTAPHFASDRPDLVISDITPYGHNGPYANLPADDGISAALANLMGAQQSMRTGPTYLVLPLSSYAAAMITATSVCAALLEREKIGAGQSVSTSLLGAGFAMRYSLVKADVEGVAPPTRRDPRGSSPTYRLYEAGDGKWFILADPRADALDRLLIAIERTDLMLEPGQGGVLAVIPLDKLELIVKSVSQVIKTQPLDHWMQVLRSFDLPVAPANTREEYVRTDLVGDNEMLVTILDPVHGPTDQMNFPLAVDGAPGVRGPAPRLGEHNAILSAPPAPRRAPRERRGSPSAAPLAGIRVIDASGFLAGPHATRMLASLGADVIKVESPRGDGMRGPAAGNPTFISSNTGKRSLCYNHGTPEGRELFYDLIRTTDILIDGFRPATQARMGIDYATLSKINPRLIQCSITGFGRAEKWSAFPSFDPVIGALSGALAAQGGRGQPPVFTGSSSAPNDLGAAYLSTFAAVAALYERERTGRGRNIPVPQVAASMAVQATEMIFRNGQPGPDRGGQELLGLSATYRLFKASDRWVFLAGKDAKSWPVICRVLGLDALAKQHTAEQATSAAPTSVIGEALAGAFAARPAAEWSGRLIEAGIACVPVISIDDPDYNPDVQLTSPQIAANELVARHQHPVFGTVRQPGQFVRFDGKPAVFSRSAPVLGEHNEEIARSLGYDDARITALREKGVLAGGA